jgi:hypothetical protein
VAWFGFDAFGPLCGCRVHPDSDTAPWSMLVLHVNHWFEEDASDDELSVDEVDEVDGSLGVPVLAAVPAPVWPGSVGLAGGRPNTRTRFVIPG